MSDNTLISIASELAGTSVSDVVQASHGGNSRVYKVTTPQGPYALKHYPVDKRDRLNTEQRALELMAQHGIDPIPEWFAAQSPYALMSWVDGAVIRAPEEGDIDEAASFLGTLHSVSQKTPVEALPLASEACLSPQSIIDQMEQRVGALMAVAAEDARLKQFLSQRFLPLYTKRFVTAKSTPGFANELPHSERTLIAADFGFHNIMRSPGGQLTFIDFEYFGWDDPVKLMCDFLLHPATPLSGALQKRFYSHAIGIYGEGIAPRFAATYPLFGLRWALILLNEFILERWQARQNARGDMDWGTVKTEQLAKAEAMLNMSEKFE